MSSLIDIRRKYVFVIGGSRNFKTGRRGPGGIGGGGVLMPLHFCSESRNVNIAC